MTQALERNSDRYFVHQAITWEQFKTLQSAFAEISGVRFMYCEGALEIMGLGLLHEMVCTLLGGLLMTYFSLKRINFISTGAYSQIIEPKTEFQADLSYSFSGDREATDREHPTFVELPSSPSPFSQEGRRGAGLKSLSRPGRGI